MAKGEGIWSIVSGLGMLIVGIVTVLVPAIPFLCIGFLIFGPVIMAYGIYKELRKPAVQYPPAVRPYYQQPYQPTQYPQQQPPYTAPRGYFCPRCGWKMRFITEYQRWYCDNCRGYR